jgi:hypothetical protein
MRPLQPVHLLVRSPLCIGSDRNFYPLLYAHGQGPNHLWSSDITYLTTSICGVWLYLSMLSGAWSRLSGRGAATLEARLVYCPGDLRAKSLELLQD